MGDFSIGVVNFYTLIPRRFYTNTLYIYDKTMINHPVIKEPFASHVSKVDPEWLKVCQKSFICYVKEMSGWLYGCFLLNYCTLYQLYNLCLN